MSVTNISVSYGRYFFKTTVQSMKEIMSDLKPDDLTTKPGPSHASRFKDMLKTLLTSYPNSLSAIAGPIMQVMEESRYSEYKSAPCDLGISMAAEA
eukprot:SAG25_NODE_8_length_29132_cov_108.213895_2_plen_96_part_00